jgi:ABC-type dipeptide/oligopeptide/nickel transport system permease subunit
VLDFASFVFLITFLLAIPAGIIAIVLGTIAIRKMKAPNANSEGRGMAIGGVVCGGVGAALGVAAVVFFVWLFVARDSLD